MRQFATYAAVGVVGTAAHYGVLVFLVQTGVTRAPAATTVGFTVGAIANYLLNYYFTFGSVDRHGGVLPKFLLVAASGALVNYWIVLLFTTHADIHYLLAQLFSTTVVLAWTYAANRMWTFAIRRA